MQRIYLPPCHPGLGSRTTSPSVAATALGVTRSTRSRSRSRSRSRPRPRPRPRSRSKSKSRSGRALSRLDDRRLSARTATTVAGGASRRKSMASAEKENVDDNVKPRGPEVAGKTSRSRDATGRGRARRCAKNAGRVPRLKPVTDQDGELRDALQMQAGSALAKLLESSMTPLVEEMFTALQSAKQTAEEAKDACSSSDVQSAKLAAAASAWNYYAVKADATVQELQARNANYAEELERLRGALKTWVDRNTDLAGVKEKYKELFAIIQSLNKTVEGQAAALEKAKSSHCDQALENKRLREQVESRDKKLEDRNKELARVVAAKAALEERMEDGERRIKEKDGVIERLEQTEAQMKATVEQSAADIARLQAEGTAARAKTVAVRKKKLEATAANLSELEAKQKALLEYNAATHRQMQVENTATIQRQQSGDAKEKGNNDRTLRRLTTKTEYAAGVAIKAGKSQPVLVPKEMNLKAEQEDLRVASKKPKGTFPAKPHLRRKEQGAMAARARATTKAAYGGGVGGAQRPCHLSSANANAAARAGRRAGDRKWKKFSTPNRVAFG